MVEAPPITGRSRGLVTDRGEASGGREGAGVATAGAGGGWLCDVDVGDPVETNSPPAMKAWPRVASIAGPGIRRPHFLHFTVWPWRTW